MSPPPQRLYYSTSIDLRLRHVRDLHSRSRIIRQEFHLVIPRNLKRRRGRLAEERHVVEDLTNRPRGVVLAHSNEEVVGIETHNHVGIEERIHIPRNTAELIRSQAILSRLSFLSTNSTIKHARLGEGKIPLTCKDLMIASEDCEVGNPGINLAPTLLSPGIHRLEEEILCQRTIGAGVTQLNRLPILITRCAAVDPTIIPNHARRIRRINDSEQSVGVERGRGYVDVTGILNDEVIPRDRSAG